MLFKVYRDLEQHDERYFSYKVAVLDLNHYYCRSCLFSSPDCYFAAPSSVTYKAL